MSVGTLLTLDCEEFCSPCDCRIWFEQCYVRWRCAGSAVRVYAGGVLVSQDSEGEIYRPQYGLWELFACNGDGCEPVLLDSVNVAGWSPIICPEANCCTGKDFARFQVPSFQYDVTVRVENRDLRDVSGVGRFVEFAELHEWIDFDFGGSYLFDLIESDCNFGVQQKVAEAMLYSQGSMKGTWRPGSVFLFPFATVCDEEAEVNFEALVEIWFRRFPVQGGQARSEFYIVFVSGNHSYQYTGPGYVAGVPSCGVTKSFSGAVSAITPLANRIVARSTGAAFLEDCEYSTEWEVGAIGESFPGQDPRRLTVYEGWHSVNLGAGTLARAIVWDMLASASTPWLPVIGFPHYPGGSGYFDYV